MTLCTVAGEQLPATAVSDGTHSRPSHLSKIIGALRRRNLLTTTRTKADRRRRPARGHPPHPPLPHSAPTTPPLETFAKRLRVVWWRELFWGVDRCIGNPKYLYYGSEIF